jgi:hypothetical protein
VHVNSLPVEPRLQKRYQRLVAEHLGQAETVAPGPRLLPGPAAAFAATQAAWRFYHNPTITPQALAQPLLDVARAAVARDCTDYVLAVHDWSDLTYRTHTSKHDCLVLGQAEEIGYELASCLLLDDAAGQPLAPVVQSVKAASGLYSSRYRHPQPLRPEVSNLDALIGTMHYVRRLDLARPAVHMIDAEADSVGHLRAWAKAKHLFLVRVKGTRLVKHQGQAQKLRAIVDHLQQQQGAFTRSRTVLYHGRRAEQWVAETTVVWHRPARRERQGPNGQKHKVSIPGPALKVRLVVSQVRAANGTRLAEWLLVTNVPAEVTAATVALWYYWRWRIESYFKLLKSAGQQLEHWQQETAEAVTKRLLVASMACVLVWQVARAEGAPAERFRDLLVRLSGRQLKWGQRWTLPALLAGMWVLLAMQAVWQQYSAAELQELIALLPLPPNPQRKHAPYQGLSP